MNKRDLDDSLKDAYRRLKVVEKSCEALAAIVLHDKEFEQEVGEDKLIEIAKGIGEARKHVENAIDAVEEAGKEMLLR